MSALSFLLDARTIAARDTVDIWRDGRFRWTSVALLAILLVSLISGWMHTTSVARLHAEAQRIEREPSLDKGDMNPHAAAHYGAFVFKPVAPLAAIDPGVDPFVGVSMFLEAHQQEMARHRPAEDATPARRLGVLSTAMSLQALVPLLIVVLAYAAFAGEREQGTLRQVASMGTGRWAFVLGKTIGVSLPLAAVLVPAAAAGLATMMVVSPAVLDADEWPRVAGLVLVYLVYFGIWVGLGLAVSARARSSRSAMVALVAIWFANVFVAPRAASTLAGWLDPAPTAAEFALAVADARHRLPSWTERVERVEERFLAGDLPLDPGVPSNPEVIALVDAEGDETALYDAQFGRVFEAYDRQARTFGRLSAGAPVLAMQSLSMALAGTDYASHRRFVEAAAHYRTEFVRTLNAELSAYENVDTFEYTRGRDLWEKIPEFTFEPPGAIVSLGEQRLAVAALMVWFVVVWGLVGWATATMAID